MISTLTYLELLEYLKKYKEIKGVQNLHGQLELFENQWNMKIHWIDKKRPNAILRANKGLMHKMYLLTLNQK